MKISFLLLSAFVLGNACYKVAQEEKKLQEPHKPKVEQSVTKKWQLVWEDNFDRDDIFATNIWSKISRNEKIDWRNTMSDDPSLYDIKEGNLILYGKMNTDLKADPSEYITGGVYTIDKRYFETGRVEVRCKLESTQGAWPAIWMLPKEGKWPTGGEIDIMEHLNYDDFVYQTLHTSYTKKVSKQNPKSGSTAKINPNDYNVYAVEWDAESVRLYVNGVQTLSYPYLKDQQDKGQYPFVRPYYLLIDMQLGGNWVGAVKPFDKPVAMYIDWIRYYQLAD